jgi:hypothetical protein
MDYKNLYLKYKVKYLHLKKQSEQAEQSGGFLGGFFGPKIELPQDILNHYNDLNKLCENKIELDKFKKIYKLISDNNGDIKKLIDYMNEVIKSNKSNRDIFLFNLNKFFNFIELCYETFADYNKKPLKDRDPNKNLINPTNPNFMDVFIDLVKFKVYSLSLRHQKQKWNIYWGAYNNLEINKNNIKVLIKYFYSNGINIISFLNTILPPLYYLPVTAYLDKKEIYDVFDIFNIFNLKEEHYALLIQVFTNGSTKFEDAANKETSLKITSENLLAMKKIFVISILIFNPYTMDEIYYKILTWDQHIELKKEPDKYDNYFYSKYNKNVTPIETLIQTYFDFFMKYAIDCIHTKYLVFAEYPDKDVAKDNEKIWKWDDTDNLIQLIKYKHRYNNGYEYGTKERKRQASIDKAYSSRTMQNAARSSVF